MGSTNRPNLSEGNLLGTEGYTTKNFAGNKEIYVPGTPGLEGGKEIYEDILNELRTGMPKELRNLIETQSKGAIAGNLKSGEEQINRSFAKDEVPIGAKIDAVSGLRQNANKALNDLYLNLGEMDYNAKNRAYSKYADLLRLAMEKGNMLNNARLQGYAIDKENDFNLGKAFGGLFGSAGNILGGIV